jgi:hypothetical protein
MIKLRTVMSGPDGIFQPGVHTFDAAREKALIEAGYAEPVPASLVQRHVETATARPGENAAVAHSARRQRRG